MRRRSDPTPLSRDPATAEPASDSPASTKTRIALRLDELATALGISRRTVERERSSGRFPKADLHIGKMPLWKPETIRAWIDGDAHG